MKEPVYAPPKPTGSREGDFRVLSEWLEKLDSISTSDYGRTVPSFNGSTVALLKVGAAGLSAVTLGFGIDGGYDADAVLELVRQRVRAWLKRRQLAASGQSLEYELDAPEGSFSGCRNVDYYISAIIDAHAASATRQLVDLLEPSPGRARPPTLED